MFKYINEQLAGNNAVHINPGPFILCQRIVLLHYYERPGFYLSHLRTGFGYFMDCFIREQTVLHLSYFKGKKGGQEFGFPQLLQRLAQLRLQDYHQCNHTVHNYVFGNP